MLHAARLACARAIARALAVATLATAAAGGLAIQSAQATTGQGVHLRPLSSHTATHATFTIPAGATHFSATVHGAHVSITKSAAQVPQTITCTLTPQTPFRYFGGPFGGGEEGIAQVQCTGVVYEIKLEVALFLNGVQVTYNSTTTFSTTFATADTEYPLSAGNYTTGADAYITWTFGGSTSFIPLTTSPTVFLP
jgi:hypothetical protein